MAELSQEQINRVEDIVNAQTWVKRKRIFEAQSEQLLTNTTDHVFDLLLEQFRGNIDALCLLEIQRELLMRCRLGEIEAAFADAEELEKGYHEVKELQDAGDLPRCITLCQTVLRSVKHATQPHLWAQLQEILAWSLSKTPQGERAANLEQAIHHYEQVLQVQTHQAFPLKWAEIQHSLARIYMQHARSEQEPAEDLEQAISHLEQALQVYTPQTFSEMWADTQVTLGNVYERRIRGQRSDNLEQAIRYYEQALQVQTRQTFPLQWADTQQNLANIYRERMSGEPANNQEQAILLFEQVLQVRTRQAFPLKWADTQVSLGLTYRDRIRGKNADNLEQAISSFEQALQIYTPQVNSTARFMIQYNLGLAYRDRIHGERSDDLEQAISYFKQALEALRALPEPWARTQVVLGLTYIDRICGEPSDNQEQAIRCYEQALKVYTSHAFPQMWAMTHHNLANAYRERISGKRVDNQEQAISHFRQALEVYTPQAFPRNCRRTAYWLGYQLYEEHRFSEARKALDIAHQAVETLRDEMQHDVAKRTLAEENADLYARLVSCCLREEDKSAAFKYTIAAKGRAFIDQLGTTPMDLSTASASDPALADDLQKARELRQKISKLTYFAIQQGKSMQPPDNSPDAETPSPASPILEMLRTQVHSLQMQETNHWEEMIYKYPALMATQKTPVFSVDQMCKLAAELNATLVEYYCHSEGWCAFVITPTALHYLPLPRINDTFLQRMTVWMQRIDEPGGGGRNKLSYYRLFEWHEAAISPLEAYIPADQPVVLAPFGILHGFPLSAACQRQSGRYVSQDYQLAFVPCLSALHTLRNQVRLTSRDEDTGLRRLLSVAYPGMPYSKNYLPNVLSEVQTIATHFPKVTQLYQEKATPDAVLEHSRNQDVVHFGCHGWFDGEHPEQSGLMLAGGWLTVQSIMTELRLEQTYLATLAACSSGRAALQRGDEQTGLLQAMFATGVQAVLTSLWSVDDPATRALFETFYAGLAEGDSPAIALQKAAQFVRDHPKWAHPYYWAAFQVSGLAHKQKKDAIQLLQDNIETTQSNDQEQQVFQDLASCLGEWPFLCKLVNGVLCYRVNHLREPLSSVLFYLRTLLEQRSHEDFDAKKTGERKKVAALTLEISLLQMTPVEQERFKELALFPLDTFIPLTTISQLWRVTGNFTDLETEELCQRLSIWHVLRFSDFRRRNIHLHETASEYLKGVMEMRLPILHQQFLDSYALHHWADLSSKEPYLWEYLAEHLLAAKRGEMLITIVKDVHYIAAKTFTKGIPAIEQDLDASRLYAPDDATLALLHQHITRIAPLLQRGQSKHDIEGILWSRLEQIVGLEKLCQAWRHEIQHPLLSAWYPFPDLREPPLIPAHEGIRQNTPLEEESEHVNDCAISSDGSFLVTASSDGALKIWNIETGVCRRTFMHAESIGRCVISSDNSFIVSFADDNVLRIWDTETGVCRRTFVPPNEVDNYVIGPDGSFFVTTSIAHNTLKLWDLHTGKCLRIFQGHTSMVYGCAISPDGNFLASASYDETLKLWDLHTGECLRTFTGHAEAVINCAISSDGNFIVSASSDKTLKLWHLHTGECLRSFTGHANQVWNCAISPDSNFIISTSSDDKTFKLWNTQNGDCIFTFYGDGALYSCAFHPDGKHILATGERGIYLLHINW